MVIYLAYTMNDLSKFNKERPRFTMLFFVILESTLPDQRVLNYLQNFLDGVAVPQKTILDIATLLMPKEVYQDDIRCYQEKVASLERRLEQSKLYMPPRREETQTSLSCDSSGSGSERAGSANGDHIIKATYHGRDIPNWDIPTKEEDLEILLREKDEIIKRKDEESDKKEKEKGFSI